MSAKIKKGKNARKPKSRSHSRKRLDFNTNVIGDYRNDTYLRSFVTSDRGKILPRRITGMPAKRHRQLVRAIKRARNVLLMK